MAKPANDNVAELEWSDSFPLSPDEADTARRWYGKISETQATVAARLGVAAWKIAAMLRRVSFVAFLPERDIYERHAEVLGQSLSDYIGDLVSEYEYEHYQQQRKIRK